MLEKQNIILIVEDDPQLSEQYKALCLEALRQLRDEESMQVHNQILQAYNYEDARRIITDPLFHIDFASVDLALTKDEHNMTGIKPQPGGMRVLQDFKKLIEPPVSVVLTGEERLDYAKRALQNYAVLSFFQKDFLDVSEYMSAIKSAMWYQHLCQITDTLVKNISPEAFETAQFAWQRTQSLSIAAGHDNWPLLAKPKTNIELAQNKLIHTYTGLPLLAWTEQELRERVVGHTDVGVIRVRINNIHPFLNQYASQEKSVFTRMRDLLQITQTTCAPDLFIGHLSVYDPDFVIIVGEKDQSALECIEDRLKEFNKTADIFFPFGKKEEGISEQERLSLVTETFWVDTEPFHDLHELLDKLRTF